MSLFPQRFIDDLRLQANIVQVVQDYLPLRRAGTKYKGLCPFHSEKTPSFHVDPEKGFFHCFGCHAGGDVFKFLELHEKVAFPDAVRMLAQKFGVALPEVSDEGADGPRQDARLREELLKIHEVAAGVFPRAARRAGRRTRAAAAAGPRGERSNHRATRSGLRAAVPRRVARGARRPGDPARARSSRADSSCQRDGGEVVDRFRNRLIVPICRETGSVVAFGGRAMSPGPAAQVPELAGNGDLLEKPDALRLEPHKSGDPEARLRGARRGLLRLRPGYQAQAAPVGGVVRHGADGGAGPPASPVHDKSGAELRPRRRR